MRRFIALVLAVASLAASGFAADRLFEDLFSGANGSRPDKWDFPGGEPNSYWIRLNSELASGDASSLKATGGYTYAVVKSATGGQWSDYFVQVDFWNPEPVCGALIVGRWQDSKNYYEGGVFSDGTTSYLAIDLISNGQRKNIARQNAGPDCVIPEVVNMKGPETRQVLRMVFSGSDILLSIAGKGQLRITDSTLKAGTAGVGVKDDNALFDNFIVSDKVSTVFAGAAAGNTGGPVAPNLASLTVGAGKGYQVRVASGLDKEQATELQRDLQQNGFSPVDVAEKDGKYIVLAGTYSSEADATAGLADVRSKGYFQAEGVQESGGANAAKVVSSAEAGKVYRVLVSEMPTKETADNASKSLIADGFGAVEVVQEGANFQVLMGSFGTEDEARKLSDQLVKDGYAAATVWSGREVATAAPAPETKVELTQEAKTGLSAAEQSKAEELIAMRTRVEAGRASADEMIEMRRQLKEVSEQVKKVVNIVSTNEQEKREKQQQLAVIFSEYGSMLVARKWDDAAKKLEEARKIEPSDPRIEIKADQLIRMRTSATSAATPGDGGSAAERMKTYVDNARKAEAAGDLTVAKSFWQQVFERDPNNAEAKSKIETLTAEIQKKATSAPMPAATAKGGGVGGINPYLLYGGIGAVVVILAGVLFVFMQNLRREKELIAKVEELTHQNDGAPTKAAAKAEKPAGDISSKKKSPTPSPLVAEELPAAGPAKLGGLSGGLGGDISAGLFGGSGFDTLPDEEEVVAEAKAPEPKTEPPAVLESRPAGEADVVNLGDLSGLSLPSFDPGPLPSGAVSGFSETLQIDAVPPLTSSLPDITPPEGGGLAAPSMPAAPALPEINIDALLSDGVFDSGPKAPAETPPPVGAPSAKIEDIVSPPVLDLPGLSGMELPTTQLPELTPPPAALPAPTAVELPTPPQALPAVAPGAPPQRKLDETYSPTTQQRAPDETYTPEMPLPVAAPSGEEVTMVAPAPVPAGDPNNYFVQTFDDLPSGIQPGDWKGDYEYATLTVEDKSGGNGNGRCLKFEKKSGAGSANYTCRFPKASGRVIVEFDLRCDEKNKYLLGFYVEKDEDFKQSVHTIIHRIDSKSQPSLRIQGEPIPYDLGSWRHIKYDLNLMLGLLTAYVDDQEVVKEAKLATSPNYVNTLSIRDNLATTGVFYLDNIKVYKG
ncbi:MAG: SPOR domain-containing protein [Candidatus Sumerlaeaceae bacterium]|nr:SPOR domain-containing protein [Candidatus Sumerlaeaceae bacterium]